MKKIILIIFFVQIIFLNHALSQDTSIVNYYPTKVGNTWIYFYNAFGNQCSCGQYVRISIIGSVLKYGKTYYIFQTTTRQTYNCWESGFDTTRVDSVTGNILRFTETGNCYLPHDIIVDSLRSKIGDSLRNCAQFAEVCTDTGITTVFGLSRQFKRFEAHAIDASWASEYIRDIGFSRYDVSLVLNCNSQLNLLGCVINGVVYGDTTFTQPDTSLLSYLPLKAGNVWVYYGDGGSPYGHSTWFDRFELTSTLQINGKTYYNFDHKRRIVYTVGTYVIFSPRLFSSDSAIRIDSTTLNTYTKFSCGGNPESLIDSLKANKNDTFNVCGQPWGSKVFCYDTAYYNIFGFNLPSKYFSFPMFEGESSQTYVKNFGICRARISYLMEGYTTNLTGCVIDGIVYGDTTFTQFHSVTGTVRYQDNNQNVTNGYVKAYRHSYQGYMDVLDSAVIQPNGTYTLTRIPSRDTTDLMAFQNDELSPDFVPTYYVSTIYWQEADHLLLNNDTSGIDIRVYRATNDRFGIGEISGGVYGYYNADAWKGISDARLYAVSQSTFRSYDITGETGAYSIDSLASGFYQIICNRIGFPTQTRYVDLGNINRNNINFYFDHLVAAQFQNNIPDKYELFQNYPNPFNPVTTIKFQVPVFDNVTLKIFDVLGREVTTLADEQLKPGIYEIEWDASNYPSGVYFCRIWVSTPSGESGTYTDSKKMVLIK